MLIVVVTIFALLWLPHRGLLAYNTIASMLSLPRYMNLWFLMFSKTCLYINRLAYFKYYYPKIHLSVQSTQSCTTRFQPSFENHSEELFIAIDRVQMRRLVILAVLLQQLT